MRVPLSWLRDFAPIEAPTDQLVDAFNELGPKASEIQTQLSQIANVKVSARTRWQEELVALREKLILYERLKNSLLPNTRLQQDASGKACGSETWELFNTAEGGILVHSRITTSDAVTEIFSRFNHRS